MFARRRRRWAPARRVGCSAEASAGLPFWHLADGDLFHCELLLLDEVGIWLSDLCKALLLANRGMRRGV
jgi:hypothetical protein